MKALWRSGIKVALVMLLLAAFCATQAGSHHSHVMALLQAGQVVGGWSWANFGAGLVCGAGIVAIAGGALSGVGAPAAIMAVSGVAGACIGMVG